ncbi:MAG: DNRLRE domain-containing protein [Candidatus Altiarchaeales archaeon]|nr:DNRLRE domain-containing protein [Candidatus Altiarchaeales archaeon]MBD3416147.1 DNRLRE domain-containing protein [Candidatus Altiarchaeales archaeon]
MMCSYKYLSIVVYILVHSNMVFFNYLENHPIDTGKKLNSKHKLFLVMSIVAFAQLAVSQLTVDLNTPVDGGNVSDTSVTFNCTAYSPGPGLENVTLYFSTIGAGITQTAYFQDDRDGYTGTRDATIKEGDPDNNYETEAPLYVDGSTPSGYENWALMKFDISSIPSYATVTGVNLSVYIVDQGDAYAFYQVKRDWVESEVTYNEYSSGNSWETAGAKGANDIGSTVLARLPGTGYSGNQTIQFNPDGIALVQDWVDGTTSNYGFIIVNVSMTGGTDIASSEGDTERHPVLAVTYQYGISWHANETKSASGAEDNLLFTKTLTDNVGYEWNCLAVDTPNAQNFSISNYTFSLNTSFIPGYPNSPQLIYPPDGSFLSTTDVLLNVTVDEPEAGGLDVTFYGRNVSENFTMIALPDTQNYVEYEANAPIFTNQTQWIAQHYSDMNIKMVLHEGDVGDHWNSDTEYVRANTSLSVLDNHDIPYSVVPGNHDHEGDTDSSTAYYNTYFPVSRYEGESWWGGNYSGNDNNYQLMTINGMDFIFLSLDVCPSDDEIRWANETFEAYPDRRGILTTHAYLDSSGGRTPHYCSNTQYIWDDLIRHHDNLQIVLCGHVHSEKRRTDDNLAGNPVHQMLADYQDLSNGGNGYLRILTFSPADDTIYVKTYSPYLEQYDTDSESEFTLAYTMSNGYADLGGIVGVESGSHANITWSEPWEDTTYQWFVSVVDDESKMTNSTVWSFNIDNLICTGRDYTGTGNWDVTSDNSCLDTDISVQGLLNVNNSLLSVNGLTISLNNPMLRLNGGQISLADSVLAFP